MNNASFLAVAPEAVLLLGVHRLAREDQNEIFEDRRAECLQMIGFQGSGERETLDSCPEDAGQRCDPKVASHSIVSHSLRRAL